MIEYLVFYLCTGQIYIIRKLYLFVSEFCLISGTPSKTSVIFIRKIEPSYGILGNGIFNLRPGVSSFSKTVVSPYKVCC